MASARCPVCSHGSRAAIETAILNGKPRATIAKDFGFTYVRSKDDRVVGNAKAITRHVEKCMGDAFQKAIETRELASGERMATRLQALEDEVDAVIARAKEGRVLEVGGVPILDDDGKPVRLIDNRLILAAIGHARANVELLAKLAGKVETPPEGLDAIKAHLQSPEARRLLARLEELAATQE